MGAGADRPWAVGRLGRAVAEPRAPVLGWSTSASSTTSPVSCSRVLVANGDNDRMVPMRNSHQLAEQLPHARLGIDADAGRGFLFQHPQDVAAEVQSFLA